MLPSNKGVKHKQSEELEHHPRRDRAGGGELPDGGHDHALLAGEDHGHRRRGQVMLTSKDTVTMTVPIQTLGCEYNGCRFQTGDHMPGTL